RVPPARPRVRRARDCRASTTGPVRSPDEEHRSRRPWGYLPGRMSLSAQGWSMTRSQSPDTSTLWSGPLFALHFCSSGQEGIHMNTDTPEPAPEGHPSDDSLPHLTEHDISAGQHGFEGEERSGLSLRRSLLDLVHLVVAVVTASQRLEVQVDNVVIAVPEDMAESRPGVLVLLFGVRGVLARHLLRALAEQGATAVAVKTTGPVEELRSPQGGAPRRGDDELQTLRREARESGVTLLAVRPEVRWDQLQSVCRSIVDDARLTTAEDLTE